MDNQEIDYTVDVSNIPKEYLDEFKEVLEIYENTSNSLYAGALRAFACAESNEDVCDTCIHRLHKLSGELCTFSPLEERVGLFMTTYGLDSRTPFINSRHRISTLALDDLIEEIRKSIFKDSELKYFRATKVKEPRSYYTKIEDNLTSIESAK